jgi:hypothetical protein
VRSAKSFVLVLVVALSSVAWAGRRVPAYRRVAPNAVETWTTKGVPDLLADPGINLVLVRRPHLRFGKIALSIAERLRERQDVANGYLTLPPVQHAAQLPKVLSDTVFGGTPPAEVEPWMREMYLLARLHQRVSRVDFINTLLIFRSTPGFHVDRSKRSLVTNFEPPTTRWVPTGAPLTEAVESAVNDLLIFRGLRDPNPLLHAGPDSMKLRLTTVMIDSP